MRHLLIVAMVLVAAAVVGAAPAQEADAIVGAWLTEPDDEDGRARVEIERVGDTYRGTIVWLEQPLFPAGDPLAGQPKVDRENPDPDRRTRPVVGLQIMEGFRYAGDREWKGGSIYDPANGKTYSCRIRMTAPDRLKVRGFIGVSLLGRTTEWTRAPAPAAEPAG